MKREDTIGLIGFGNMGSAIALQLKDNYRVFVYEKDTEKVKLCGLKPAASSRAENNLHSSLGLKPGDFCEGLKNASGVTALGGIEDIMDACLAIIIAVKPQDFYSVLEEMRGKVKQHRVISIAAGITTAFIEENIGNVAVVRAMPNLPARVGMGMICLCKGRYALETDLSFAQKLFSYLGKTLIVQEPQMNAVTAISGSGPGFFFALIQDKPECEWAEYGTNIFTPLLIEAGLEMGFNQQEAQVLAVATTEGSIALLRKTKLSPLELRRQVTSKGGTTAAGLEALARTQSLVEAVRAAAKRAEELSRGI